MIISVVRTILKMGYNILKQWQTKEGFIAVVINTSMGHNCGYVGNTKKAGVIQIGVNLRGISKFQCTNLSLTPMYAAIGRGGFYSLGKFYNCIFPHLCYHFQVTKQKINKIETFKYLLSY